jgi:hypothetical protein
MQATSDFVNEANSYSRDSNRLVLPLQSDGVVAMVMRYRDQCFQNLEALRMVTEPRLYETARREFLETEIESCQRMLAMTQPNGL